MDLDAVILPLLLLPVLPDAAEVAGDLLPEEEEGLAVGVPCAAVGHAPDHVDAGQVLQVLRQLLSRQGAQGNDGRLLLVLRHPGAEGVVQLVQLDGLGQKVVEAAAEKLLPHALHGVGGQGDDGHHGEIGVFLAHLPDMLGGLHAVHVRHHVVHEDQVGPDLGHLPQGLRAGAGGVDLHLIGAKQALADLQVQGLVVHHQDHRFGGGEGVVAAGVRPLLLAAIGAAGGGVDDFLGQAHPEVAAHAVGAVHAQLAVHQLRELLADGQAQAGALDVPVGLAVQAAVALEDVGQVLLADAHAGILHVDDQYAVLPLGLPGDGEGDGALLGVLDGVAAQVHHNMTDVHVVAVERRRNILIQLGVKVQLFFLGTHPQDRHHIVEGRVDVIALLGDLHLARLDLGQVQDAVDVVQQNAAAAADVPEAVVLGLVGVLPQAQLGHAQNRVEGGADVMAHVGQELALGLAGGLGGLGGDAGLFLLLAEVNGGRVVLKDPQRLLVLGRVAGHGKDPQAEPGVVLLVEEKLHLTLLFQAAAKIVEVRHGLKRCHIVGVQEPLAVELQRLGLAVACLL